ncbi:DUF4037 domain-containing protein [Streptomyces sp. NBC_00887]|uniref:DUF4037 domain-containing protein n=1 Tax=Streptomyces sp. NBC_00887 TaxID=2975859 RepID=UPI0038651C0A|nr:DUF4037 domain-containing protein [Streptomyces sp. NBC_00887]WSY36348.1 DUF4037 domain-containing protein [Streptomyces sp. NBC_00887]
MTAAADDALRLFKHYDTGRFALTLSGSMSKGTSDELSDTDFRFYSDTPRPDPGPEWDADWQAVRRRWAEKGVVLDEPWFRTVAEVDAVVDSWLGGHGTPDDLVWTVWGYHPLADLACQIPVHDPDGLVSRWRDRLEPYPDTVRHATIQKFLPALRYWRDDYHYRNKVERADLTFLSSLTAKLIHHILQVLAAVNRVYYPGDGNNLRQAAAFHTAPEQLVSRIAAVLYPPGGSADVRAQRNGVIALIDETIAVVKNSALDEEDGA